MTERRAIPTTANPTQLTLAMRAARAATGGAQDVERLRRRLEAALGAGGGSAPTVSGMEAPTALSGAKAWMLLLAAAAGVSVLVYLGLHRDTPERNAAQRASAPAFIVGRAPSQVIVQPSAESLPGVTSAEGAPTSGPPLRAPTVRKIAAVRASAARSRARSVAGSTLPSDPDAEIALVTGAQSLMVRQPKEALALLTEHERRFPHGLLAQERDTLRIDAERALGRRALALEHARAFVAQFPDSPQARAIKRWLAGEDNVHNPPRAPVLTP